MVNDVVKKSEKRLTKVPKTLHEKRKGTVRYGHGVKFGSLTVFVIIRWNL